jgi:hypothetical protein
LSHPRGVPQQIEQVFEPLTYTPLGQHPPLDPTICVLGQDHIRSDYLPCHTCTNFAFHSHCVSRRRPNKWACNWCQNGGQLGLTSFNTVPIPLLAAPDNIVTTPSGIGGIFSPHLKKVSPSQHIPSSHSILPRYS